LAEHKAKSGDAFDRSVDEEEEAEQKQKEMKDKKEKTHKLIEKANSDFKADFNPIDGLLHKNGKKIDPNDGMVI